MGDNGIHRRTLLASGGSGVAALLAGCSVLDGSDESDGTNSIEFETSFESDELGADFEDTSESNVTPELTTEHSHDGEQALLLPATPGNETVNRVTTKESFEPPVRAEVRVKPLTEVTRRTKISLIFKSPDSKHHTTIRFSRYDDDPVTMAVVTADGEKTLQGVASETPPVGEWTDLSLTVRSDEVTAEVGGVEESVSIEGWDSTGVVDLRTNAWSNASEDMNAAFDSVRIQSL